MRTEQVLEYREASRNAASKCHGEAVRTGQIEALNCVLEMIGKMKGGAWIDRICLTACIEQNRDDIAAVLTNDEKGGAA